MQDTLSLGESRLDALTRVYHHDALVGELEKRCAGASADEPLSLVVLDVDDFRAFNAGLGRPAGDAALRQLAELLPPAGSDSELGGRLGADEFAIILTGWDSERVQALVEQLRADARTMEHQGTPLQLTISLGLAQQSAAQDGAAALMAAARQALAAAQGAGGNCAFAVSGNGSAPIRLSVVEQAPEVRLDHREVVSERYLAHDTQQRLERRARRRMPFQTTQRVAIYYEGLALERHVFRNVECHDISSGGIAFYSEVAPPVSSALLFALGTGSNVTYLIARVVNNRRAPSERRHLVGCEFTGRLNV